MKFSQCLPLIKSGDLLAWGSQKSVGFSGFLEKTIRVFTMSEYCHVGVAHVESGKVLVFEAISPSVRLSPLTIDRPFYHIPMSVEWKDGLSNYMLSRLGEPYSFWHAIQAYFGRPSEDKQWECAQLCTDFYTEAGIILPNAWTPSTLVEAALETQNTSITLINEP